MTFLDWLTGRRRYMDDSEQHVERSQQILADTAARQPEITDLHSKAMRQLDENHLTQMWGQLINGKG